RMLDRRVIRNKVEDDFELLYMRFINDEIETFERAKDRINPTVISDIITEVMHWRGIDRRNPDRIDAEPDKIIEALPDTIKIAYAITVRVLKGPRVDLIDCPDLPPFMRHDATREATKAGATIRDGTPDRALSQKHFFYSNSLMGEINGVGYRSA